jgi:hypothetical protein
MTVREGDRKLAPEEIGDLRKAYCQPVRLRPKELLFILAISFVLSVPFVILFVLVSHFGHGDTWTQALRNSSYAIGVGPGVVALILLVVGISSLLRRRRKEFSSNAWKSLPAYAAQPGTKWRAPGS